MESLADRVLSLTLNDEPEQLRVLLEERFSFEEPWSARTPEGCAAGHVAAHEGSACLEVLLENGMPATYMSSGHTPLHFACQSGQVDSVSLLVDRFPSDADCETTSGHTPLMVCIEVLHGDEARAAACARILLRAHADPSRPASGKAWTSHVRNMSTQASATPGGRW